jgi:ADP-ribosylglycohydrolase
MKTGTENHDGDWFRKNLGAGGMVFRKAQKEVQMIASDEMLEQMTKNKFAGCLPGSNPARYNPALVALYKQGDVEGIPWEGKPMYSEPDGYRFPSTYGSDESSIVDCFLAFTENYRLKDMDQFLWDWCLYHTDHHGTGYGKTYKEHFADMKFLRKKYDAAEGVKQLYRISSERNSFGNGSLAMVYPAYCYFLNQGYEPKNYVEWMTTLNYAHPDAVNACRRLYEIIRRADYYDDTTFPEYSRPIDTIKASDTLNAAIYCADQETVEDVIKTAIYTGGDIDSFLSLALLLHGILKQKVAVCLS